MTEVAMWRQAYEDLKQLHDTKFQELQQQFNEIEREYEAYRTATERSLTLAKSQLAYYAGESSPVSFVPADVPQKDAKYAGRLAL